MFQFEVLHTRGSSHGASRITRLAYNQAFYVNIMKEAYQLWDEIERKSQRQLYWYTLLYMMSLCIMFVQSYLSIHPFIHESIHLYIYPCVCPFIQVSCPSSIHPFIPTVLYMVSSNRKTGILALGKATDSSIDLYHSSLDINGVPHKVLTGREAKKLYPRQLSIPDDDRCIFEPNGGILKASKALRTLQVLMQ